MAVEKIGKAVLELATEHGTFFSDIDKVDKKIGGLSKSVDAQAKAFQNYGKQASDLGKGLSTWLTAPILAIGAGVVAVGVQFDDAFDTIRIKTGETGTELEALEASFSTVFAGVPDSAGTVATALSELTTRTGQTGTGLEALSTQSLNLARITGGDLSGQITANTRLFGDWSVSTEKQSSVLDFLFKTSQATGAGVQSLAEKVVQFGAPLRQMGFDLETSIALLGKWEKEGVNTELVLGSMRIALGKFADAGIKDTGAALQGFIEQIKNAGTTGQANSIAMEVFGKKAGPDMAAAIREGRFAVDDLLQQLRESPETINGATQATEGFTEKATRLGHQVLAAAEPLGTALLSAFERVLPFIERGIGLVGQLVDGFMSLPAGAQIAGAAIVGIAAAAGPALSVFSGLVSHAPGAIAAGARVVTAIQGIGAAAASSQLLVTALGAGLAGLAAGAILVLASKAWEINAQRLKELNEVSALSTDIQKTLGIRFRDAGEAARALEAYQAGLQRKTIDLNGATVNVAQAWALGKQRAEGASSSTQGLSVTLGKAGEAAKGTSKQTADLNVSLEDGKKKADEFAKALENFGGKEAIASGRELERVLTALGGPLRVLPSELQKMSDGFKKSAEAARTLGNVKLAEHFEALARQTQPLTVFQQRYNVTVGQYVPIANSAAAATEALWEQFFRLTGQVQEIVPALKNAMSMKDLWSTSMGGFIAPVGQNDPGSQIGQQIVAGIKKSFDGIPALLTQAFTGGGGIGGALSALGVQISESVTRPILESLNRWQIGAVSAGAGAAGAIGGAFGGTTAATIGSIAGSIGGAVLATTALGAAAATSATAAVALGAATAGIGLAAVGTYLAVKKLFTLSKERKQAREDIKGVEDAIIDSLTAEQKAAAGGQRWAEVLIGVRDAFLATGRSAADAERLVAQMWDERNPARARDAIAQIGQAFTELAEQQRILAEGTAEADTIFEDLFATAETFGNTMPDHLRPMIDRLVEMGVVSEETAKQINGIGREGEVSIAAMKDAAEEFGIEVDSLGDRFKQQQLTEESQRILRGIKLLTDGGTDANVVLAGMTDEIQGVVTESLKFGTDIPENMKPYIQRLMDGGQLVDENGTKLTDLSRLQFGPPIADQWQVITDKLTELIDKITIALPRAINNIPDGEVNVRVDVDDSELRELGQHIGVDLPTVDMAAGGMGRVYDPTLFLAGEAGPEDFAFSGAHRNFGAMPGGGAAVIHTHVMLDGREIARAVDRVVMGDLRRQTRLNTATT